MKLDELGLGSDVASLVISASGWMESALARWADDDHAQVGMLAPLAVEHLCKAVLWQRNPALLVPLGAADETSLWLLATEPSMAAKQLKTIGLKQALDRLARVLGGTPVIAQPARDRMVSVRNGITHLGAAELSRDVLLDCLRVTNACLTRLGVPPSLFYGTYDTDVVSLLEAHRTEVGHVVLAKKARARTRIVDLEERLGADAFDEAIRIRTSQPGSATRPEYIDDQADFVESQCPACGRAARLWGALELEEEVDFDVEPMGGGRYESYPVAYWVVYLVPQALECPACRLLLRESEELAEVGIDADRRAVDESELSEEFDMSEFIRWNMYDYEDF